MRVSETIVLELQEGRAVVSTANLCRIVEMPSGRVVGELSDVDDTGSEVTSDLRYKEYRPWKIAVDYTLFALLEKQGIPLSDVAVQPIPKKHCPWCGATRSTSTKKKRTYLCGSFSRPERHKTFIWWRMQAQEQGQDCQAGELQRLRIMVEKSNLLKRILVEAGISVDNPDFWWLLDGRPDDTQFTTVPPAKFAASA